MENLMISANAVLPMCLIMALGYGTCRLGWIRREEIFAINKIAFRIFLPCLLYYNVYCSDLSGSFDPLLMAYAVGGVLLTFGLSLGYTLPRELTKKAKMDNVRFYISGNDLFSLSGFPKGWDPEVGTEGYPITTSLLFGVSVNF